jgi:hypothetical protein
LLLLANEKQSFIAWKRAFSANLRRKGTLQGHCTAAVRHALKAGWLAGWLAVGLSNCDNAPTVILKMELFSRN